MRPQARCCLLRSPYPKSSNFTFISNLGATANHEGSDAPKGKRGGCMELLISLISWSLSSTSIQPRLFPPRRLSPFQCRIAGVQDLLIYMKSNQVRLLRPPVSSSWDESGSNRLSIMTRCSHCAAASRLFLNRQILSYKYSPAGAQRGAKGLERSIVA